MVVAKKKRKIEQGSIAQFAKSNATPIILNRVSTSEQKKNLKAQVDENRKKVKALGFKKTPIEITSQESGAAADRKTVKEIIRIIEDNPRTKFVVFVRDLPRWSRDTRASLDALDTINEMGVPLYILDGGMFLDGSLKNYSVRMVFEMLQAVASSGKKNELLASLEGQAQAEEKGIFSGAVKDLYSELATPMGSIHRRVWESRSAIASKTLSNKQLTRNLKMGSPTTVRQMREFLLQMEDDFGTEKVEEYLDVIDEVIRAEKTRGFGSRKKSPMSNRARALHRVTVGYLRFPNRFPRPDLIGNPDTAVKETDKATGTIDDVINNWTRYFVQKT